MKRSYDYSEISLPSPDSDNSEDSEYFTGYNWKKCKTEAQDHDFITTVDNELLEFVQCDGSKQLKRYIHTGKNLVLIFFGIRDDYVFKLDGLTKTLSRSLNTEIIGISSNLSKNEYSFRLINGSKISKKFQVMDPIGGGVYPRDVIIIFDNSGKKRFEIPLRLYGQYLLDRPIEEVLMDSIEELQSEIML